MRADLLESLDELSPEENTRIWADEAERRAAALDAGTLSARPATTCVATLEHGSEPCRGLGAAFIAEVQRCTAEIVNHPHAAAITRGTIRRVEAVSRGAAA